MKTFAATDAKTNFGMLLDASQKAPVAITKKGRKVSVMISYDDYVEDQEHKLIELRRKLKEGIDQADRGEFVTEKEAFSMLYDDA